MHFVRDTVPTTMIKLITKRDNIIHNDRIQVDQLQGIHFTGLKKRIVGKLIDQVRIAFETLKETLFALLVQQNRCQCQTD